MTTIAILLLLGAVLMFAETILPGMIAGIAGFGCLMAAIIVGYSQSVALGNLALAIVLIGLAAGTWAWLKFFPESRMARRFVSEKSIGDLGVEKPELLHTEGKALTQLRPSGAAEINGLRVDVVAESGLIERGAKVKVVAVEGARVVVRGV